MTLAETLAGPLREGPRRHMGGPPQTSTGLERFRFTCDKVGCQIWHARYARTSGLRLGRRAAIDRGDRIRPVDRQLSQGHMAETTALPKQP